MDCSSSLVDCSSSLVDLSSSWEDCISSRVVCSSSRQLLEFLLQFGNPGVAGSRCLVRPGAFFSGGVATSVKTIITIPRSASGSSIDLDGDIHASACRRWSPTLSPLTVIASFCRSAFWKALARSKRSPSRAMAKMFQLALPAAGSRYLPVRPLM